MHAVWLCLFMIMWAKSLDILWGTKNLMHFLSVICPRFVLFCCVSRQAYTTRPTVLSPILLRRPRPTDPSPKATQTTARTLLRMPLPQPLPPMFLLQSHHFDPEIGLQQRSKAFPPKVAYIYLA